MKKLRKYGFKAVRVPVSSPSREPLLDVFTTKSDAILAFEVKDQSSGKIYLGRLRGLYICMETFTMQSIAHNL